MLKIEEKGNICNNMLGLENSLQGRLFLLCFCFFSFVPFVAAQSDDSPSVEGSAESETSILEDVPVRVSEDAFWISGGAETAMYSKSAFCFGAGLAFAYGKKVSIGIKTAYFFNTENLENRIDVLELGFLLRFFPIKSLPASGLFIQLSAGQALFLRYGEDDVSYPAQWGSIFGGVDAGWRFSIGNVFYLEPYLRAGYPFLIGGGISAGAMF